LWAHSAPALAWPTPTIKWGAGTLQASESDGVFYVRGAKEQAWKRSELRQMGVGPFDGVEASVDGKPLWILRAPEPRAPGL
jgi:hypothetical protein